MMEWISTKDKLHPDKPGIRDYEQVECLVIPKGGCLQMMCWNCEDEVWDDSQGDDTMCEADQIEWWMIIEYPAGEL